MGFTVFRRSTTLLLAALVATPLVMAPALAAPVTVPPSFDDWKLLVLPDKQPAEFKVSKDGGLQVEATDAVGFLYAEIDGAPTKRMAWRWRVDKDIPPTDLSRGGRDDRPLAVHVWFPPKPEDVTLKDRLGSLFGYPMIGQVLTYVWGGTAQRGVEMANPHFEDSKLIVLRSGTTPTGTWFNEEIDIAADYKMAFGTAPPAQAYIAISADTDDVGGTSVARLDSLKLLSAKSAAPRHSKVPGSK
ncbi:DUF3047 domain-containing protein [Pelagibius sp. Alg239-R121]|uniref:DUF3047 domain-containing protein n=1 Tax=Pelagibius sp. Alg239-R121 TaxID=2993448 RepID=UPI0024A74973|nr:DUF3047 domain-containing protein [Pelagibius sp. Alg239-R121]